MSVFGDIRSLLQEPPSSQGWEALCALFERAPESMAREQLLPYVRAHLERHWPYELRAWNKSWTRRVIRGNTILVAGLASACDLRNRQLDRESVELLARHDYIYGLRSLNLSENHHLGESLEQLALLPMLRDVHELNIGDCHTARHRDVSVFLDSPHLSKLKALNLGYYGGLNEHLRLLGTSQVRHTLESLSCSTYHKVEEFIELLHLPMPELTALTLNISQETQAQVMLATESASWWAQVEQLVISGSLDIKMLWLQRPKNLKNLNLENLFDSDVVEELTQCDGLEMLEELRVRNPYNAHSLELLKRLNTNAARRLVKHWGWQRDYPQADIKKFLETLLPAQEGSQS